MIVGERKLATIRRIANIEPIENADRIVKATIDGWELVTQKDNYRIGDLCVYFEIDSFLPVRECFEFLRKGCFKSTKNLGDGFRIKTIKLKGQVSQGLSLPLADFFSFDVETNQFYYENVEPIVDGNLVTPVYLTEGMDMTEYFQVQKYEKPEPTSGGANMGRAAGNFPSFIFKTDQERIQNCFGSIKNFILRDKSSTTEIIIPDVIDQLDAGVNINTDTDTYFKSGDMWFVRTSHYLPIDIQRERSWFEASLKMDGSSLTAYVNENTYGVCSRNLELKRDNENVFWKVVLNGKLIQAMVTVGGNYAVQGELMGPGVQGNRENLSRHMLFIFDVFDIDAQKYLTPEKREEYVSSLYQAGMGECIEPIPTFHDVNFFNFEDVAAFLAFAERPSFSNPVAEGVVFKSLNEGGPSFKAISNKYLLAEKD